MMERKRKVLPSRSMPVTMDRLHIKADRFGRVWRVDELGHRAYEREGVNRGYDFSEVMLVEMCGSVPRMIDVLTQYPDNDYYQASLYWTMDITAPDQFDLSAMPRHVFWATVFRVQRVLRKLGLRSPTSVDFSVLLKAMSRPSDLHLCRKNSAWVKKHENFVRSMLNTAPMACTLFLSPNSAFDQQAIVRRLFGLFLAYQVTHGFAIFLKLRVLYTLDSPRLFDAAPLLPDVSRGWDFVKGLVYDCAFTQVPPQRSIRLVTAFEFWFYAILAESDWISRIQEDMLKSMISCRAINVSAARALYQSSPSTEKASVALNDWCYIDVGSSTFQDPDHLCIRANTVPWGALFGLTNEQSGQSLFYSKLSNIIRKSLIALYRLDGDLAAEVLASVDDNFDSFGDFYPRTGAAFDHRQYHCAADMVTYYTTGLPTLCFSPALFADLMQDIERKMIESLLYMPEPVPHKF